MPIPTDPLLVNQWHLRNSTPGLLDLNVFGVWNPTEGLSYTGAGTRTVVIDSGIDYTHSDLVPNYNLGLDFDYETHTNDAFGGPTESHGTAVAGIIGAAANGTGAVGVAYNTQLVGYRTAQLISDAWLQDIRDAIAQAATNALADVANISQGIANDDTSEFGVGYNALRFDEIETSIGTAVNTGRGGLGMTIVKSGGNSRGDLYDINADDWTNDTRQVVVAAVDQNGFVSSYSSYGAANLVSGFGTPGQVVTTDRVGAAGYNGTDFTSSFNGTSAAAPMVTGIVSLMYEANAGLGWRDVQSILASSARHVGSAVGGGTAGSERYAWGFNAAGTWNGGGQHFSNDYGYGLVDALAAVRLSETWLLGGSSAATSSNEFTNSMDVLNASTVIPDGNATGLSFTGAAAFDDIVDRVTVQMTFSTTFTGDVNIYITSPDGTVSRLIDRAGGGNDYSGTWTFESQAFRGERAAGNWTVRVVDAAGGDVLTVSDIIIRTYGSATTNDRYIYTDENSDYAGLFGHTTNVVDSNGGTDTVNASAVTSSSTIYLDGATSTSTIDGININFQNIENAIGGDGHDIIGGNDVANLLFGLRGNDVLKGAGGADTLYGDWGDDTLQGDANDDALYGGAGSDSIYGGDGVDTLYGGDGADYLDGGLFEDNSYGEAGNDTFAVIASDLGDNVYGGADTDTLDLSGNTAPGYSFNVNLALQTYSYVPDFGASGTYIAQDIENVIGSVNGDTITGDGNANYLSGGGGADTILGGGGVDTLSGDAGDDIMDGGDGTDSLYGGAGNDAFTVGLFEGNDNFYGGGDIDTLDLSALTVFNLEINLAAGTWGSGGLVFGDAQEIENAIGSTLGDTLTGSSIANSLNGGNGSDTLNGGLGLDTTIGGLGDDTHIVDSLGDIVVEGIGDGVNDRVAASATYVLAAGVYVERLTTTSSGGGSAINLTGNAFAQTITGNAGINILSDGGLGGNDTLVGLAGNDTYIVNNVGAIIVETAGNGTNDRVATSVSFTLAADDDIELFTTTSSGAITNLSLTGNALSQTIIGNAGNNVLRSMTGAPDELRGLSGDDIYRVFNAGDTITETVGNGSDRVITVVNYTLGAGDNIELFTTDSTAGITPLSLTGNELSQTIIGNAGDNVLRSMTGAPDVLQGLGGDDVYRVFNAGDAITETVGNGSDRVITVVDYTLGAGDNIELFTTDATAGLSNLSLTGNEIAQTIQGNAGNNRIDGRGGSDSLRGNLGSDTFVFSFTLGASNIDSLVDFSSAADQIELDQSIFGTIVQAAGVMLSGYFKANASGTATDANDHIIYDTDSGELYYDTNGNVAGGVTQFAQLLAGTALTFSDFDIVV